MKNSIVLIFIPLIVFGCNFNPEHEKLNYINFQGETQGTYYIVKYFDNNGINYQNEIDSILKAIDQSVSLWVNHSIISKVNRNEKVKLDSYFIDNFNLSQKIALETEGAFDCTLGPLIEAWGFGFKQRIQLTQHMIDSIKNFIGHNKVSLKNNYLIKEDQRIEINFNAIAQGYSVDLIGKYLDLQGIKNYLIDIGGEIICKGEKPNKEKWIVGIQKPTEEKNGAIEAQIKVELKNKALVTSGSYRKYFEENGKRFSHMIDPNTGYPVTHNLLSVTVLGETCAEIDAYATAFMVMGLEKAVYFVNKRKDLDAYFIYLDENKKIKSLATKGLNKLIN